MLFVLERSYVKGHHRTLPDGRSVFIQPYFTKKIPKADTAARKRPVKVQAPTKTVKHTITPERLALRMLAHVQDARLSHDDAEANLGHLERRAQAGHGLEHAEGPAWTPAQVHQFIAHARTALAGHRQQEKRQKKRPVVVPRKAKMTPVVQTEHQLPAQETPSLAGYGALGNPSRVITATNQVAQTVGRKDIETRFAVVEAPDVIHSFDARYPQELQPRLERRPGSVDPATEQTVSRLLGHMDFESLTDSRQASQGAPILDQHRHSISGSGRLEALKRMYQQGGPLATEYKAFLVEEAPRLGLTAQRITGMRHPVLTRVITTPLTTDQLAAFADEANQRDTQAPSPLSTAVQDSKRLTPGVLSLLQPTDTGEVDLLSRGNAGFREAVLRDVIPHSEHGAVLTQGQWTADGAARLRRMIFARAYGNTPALERLTGSEQVERRNLAHSLLAAAPAFTKLQGAIDQGSLYPRSMTPDLVEAVNKLVTLSQQGETVQHWLSQTALFDEGLSPLAKDLVNILDMPKFKRSARLVTDLLHTYMEGVYALGDPRQAGLFGASTPPSAAAILAESLERVEQGDSGKQITLLDRKAA